jgi:hypothetical protein
MPADLIRIIKKRRDEVHRRIGEARSELAVLEARAEELETILKASLETDSMSTSAIIAPPKIATTANGPPTAADLILAAMRELEGAGYEAADRATIFKIVLRSAPTMKNNTLRVMLKRLVGKHVDRIGNLYRLREDGIAPS